MHPAFPTEHTRRGKPTPKDKGVREWAGRQGEQRKPEVQKKHEEESRRMLGKDDHGLKEEVGALHPEVPHNGRH